MSINEFPRRFPERVNARESVEDVARGMCCDEETARQCAEEHWRNRNKGTQLVSSILVSVFACCASAFITGTFTILFLAILCVALSEMPFITEQSAYLLSAVIASAVSIPFWKRGYKTTKEKIHYEYAVYEWIDVPAAFAAFACIILTFVLLTGNMLS